MSDNRKPYPVRGGGRGQGRGFGRRQTQRFTQSALSQEGADALTRLIASQAPLRQAATDNITKLLGSFRYAPGNARVYSEEVVPPHYT